ncbi:MAG: hypothetical protein AAB492_01815 [Patescibacteria group bacterium]
MTKASIVFVLTALTSMSLVTPVYAENNVFDRIQERVENRKEKRDEIKEDRQKESSKPAFLRGLFQRARISSGVITNKVGSILTIEKDGKSLTIQTDTKTKFVLRFGGKATIDDMLLGHTVNIAGPWSDETKTTITAKLVRDLSIQKRHGVIIGVVKSLLPNGWIMTTISDKRADQTITVGSATEFVNGMQEGITKDQVVVGHRVRVKGLWDKGNNTVTDVTQVKDFTLPVKVSVTATPTTTP